jgi:hypothetical protein
MSAPYGSKVCSHLWSEQTLAIIASHHSAWVVQSAFSNSARDRNEKHFD